MTITDNGPRLLDEVHSIAARDDVDWREADAAGRLPAAIVEELHDLGLFRLLLPERDGGWGLSLRDAFPIFEAAATVEGSLGWNLCIANIGLMLVTAALGEDGRAAILDDPRTIIAGGVNPGAVTARRVDGGYRFSGRIGFASGSADATWLFTAAVLPDGHHSPGAPPVLIGGLFPPHEASLLDTWHVTGMRATSSHDFLIDDVFVPEELTFSMALAPSSTEPLRSLPLPSILGSGLVFVALGVAAHAIHRLRAIAGEHRPIFSNEPLCHRADVQLAVARAQGLVAAGRAYVRATWDELEGATAAGGALGPGDLARLRLSYVVAVENAIAATDCAWRASGSAGLFEHEALARCWRDVHAVGQHTFVSSRHLERIGRITLGLPAGPGPI